jgi:hypothetical protein
MKKNIKKIISFLIVANVLLSCGKSIPTGGRIHPYVLLQGWISDGPWRLISYTRYKQNEIIASYKGTAQDTLQFGYTSDANENVVRTGVGIYFQGKYTVSGYKINLDSTITLNPYWRPNYDDTIKLTSFSEDLITLQVRFDSANVSCIEVDSLRKMYFN